MPMTVKTKSQKLNTGSRPNTLTRYMNEISKIKPLTLDEECALGHKIAEGDITALQKLSMHEYENIIRGYQKPFSLTPRSKMEKTPPTLTYWKNKMPYPVMNK